MSELNEKIHEEVDALKRVRDELRVQIHLGKAEAKERWEEAEKSWHHLEARLRQLREESREPVDDIAKAARNLAHEIREGYRHIKRTLSA